MTNKAEDIEPYTNLKADRSPRDPHKLNTAVQSDADVREAMREIFTEYDKPSTTKTYPGQKTMVRRGIAIDQIVDFFQVREQQSVEAAHTKAFISGYNEAYEDGRKKIEQLLSELKSGLRDYREKYPDADYDDALGYIGGFYHATQIKDSDTPKPDVYQDDREGL